MRPLNRASSSMFFLYIIAITLLTGCGETEPLKIGYVAGITGRHSELGIGVRNGLMLGITHLNESGGVNGRTLELVVRDDKGEPDKLNGIIDEFIAEDIHLIAGPLLSKMAQATLDAIEGKDVLVISPTISTDLVSNRDDNFIRLIPESSFQGESIADAVLTERYQRIGVIYDGTNGPYTRPIFEVFKNKMEKGGREIVYINDLLDGQEKVLDKVAAEVVEAKCDAIFFITSSIDAGELCQQIRKKDKKTQFYGAYWVKSGKIVEIGGRSVEGMVLTTIFEREIKSEAYKDFSISYQEKFKSTPNFTAVYAYEIVQTLAQAMKRSGSFEPDKIKEAIIEQGTFEGLEEHYYIDEYGDVKRSRALVTIKDGRFLRIDN